MQIHKPNWANKSITFIGLALAIVLSIPDKSIALQIPTLQIGLSETDNPQQVSVLIEILIIFTILSMAPAILLMMTCFTRLIVTFSFLKKALGTQTTPPNQVLIGLSLFLTLFIMTPVFSKMNETAIKPYLDEQISIEQALTEGSKAQSI